MNSRRFTPEEVAYNCFNYVEEVTVDLRKGVPQTRYIVEVKSEDEYWCDLKEGMIKVPQNLIGFWMQKWPCDNVLDGYQSRLVSDVWVKCVKEEVVTYVWKNKEWEN